MYLRHIVLPQFCIGEDGDCVQACLLSVFWSECSTFRYLVLHWFHVLFWEDSRTSENATSYLQMFCTDSDRERIDVAGKTPPPLPLFSFVRSELYAHLYVFCLLRSMEFKERKKERKIERERERGGGGGQFIVEFLKTIQSSVITKNTSESNSSSSYFVLSQFDCAIAAIVMHHTVSTCSTVNYLCRGLQPTD